MTDARNTQTALEEWTQTDAPARLTQAGLELWASVPTDPRGAILTQIGLEEWAQVPPSTISGTLAATEPADAANIAGSVAWPPLTGTLAATEPTDQASFAGDNINRGTLAAGEPTDYAHFVAAILLPVTGPLGASEPPDRASLWLGGGSPVEVVLPPVVPMVPADTTRNGILRYARAINDLLRGNLNATLQLTLVTNETASVLNDSRIGPFTSIQLKPLTHNAANLLPSIWVEPSKGSAVIHHARSSYSDLTYIACIIGG